MQDQFKPVGYLAPIATSTTAVGIALSDFTNPTKIRVCNNDATNTVRIAFGTSDGNAETNAANGMGVAPGESAIFEIPQNVGVTHVAHQAAAGTPSINLTPGR